MSFVCGMCQKDKFNDELAFTYEYIEDRNTVVEGVCGDCAQA
jgi:hypothetical protein